MSGSPASRKADVQERLLRAYGRFKSDDGRRAFRRELAKATGRSEQSVARWVGEREPMNGPPATVLERCERFLGERE